MSAELIMVGPGQPTIHNSSHNLESFFYVLAGICVLYSEVSKQKPDKELMECSDDLFNTFTPSILKMLIIQSNLTWFSKVMQHISLFPAGHSPSLITSETTSSCPYLLTKREISIAALCLIMT